ncbi:MAG: pantetheine-phosphate adenylyltransferase [Burkholderiaceae bacterium]
MTRALYPGTFDPLTRGHEDLMRRAAAMFDHVVLAIADSRSKKPMFTIEERLSMASEVLGDLSNVSVIRFSGLMVHVMQEQHATVVVRGVRSVTDFEYELQLAGMNRQMMPSLETIFLTPSDEYQHVSGTLVREIAIMKGDVERFVPAAVLPALLARAAERREGAGKA